MVPSNFSKAVFNKFFFGPFWNTLSHLELDFEEIGTYLSIGFFEIFLHKE